MAVFPAAFACQASRHSMVEVPRVWIAKSTMHVVPPCAAARVPVSKVSEVSVPPKGIWWWVWGSTPPGMTSRPAASMTRSAGTTRSRPMRATVSPWTKTSAS